MSEPSQSDEAPTIEMLEKADQIAKNEKSSTGGISPETVAQVLSRHFPGVSTTACYQAAYAAYLAQR